MLFGGAAATWPIGVAEETNMPTTFAIREFVVAGGLM